MPMTDAGKCPLEWHHPITRSFAQKISPAQAWTWAGVSPQECGPSMMVRRGFDLQHRKTVYTSLLLPSGSGGWKGGREYLRMMMRSFWL
jgi:hypothetical protein